MRDAKTQDRGWGGVGWGAASGQARLMVREARPGSWLGRPGQARLMVWETMFSGTDGL